MSLERQLPDQRSPERQPDPPCARCHASDPMCTLRTTFVIYYRCAQCGAIWTREKPLVKRPNVG